MKITINMIKELRQKTHVSMIECKKSLEKTSGNIEKAIVLLREKGIIKASQKQHRITDEGLINIIIDQNNAFLYELNSETDFVAKNEHFQQLVKIIGKTILQKQLQTVEDILSTTYQNKKIKNLILEKISILGETITLKRVLKITKKDQECFGTYKHQGGRISVLTILKNNCTLVAEDIAMHIAAVEPKFLTFDQIDPQFIKLEKNILQKQTEKELLGKKPLHILDKIVQERLNKILRDHCLLEQFFIKNPKQKIKDYLKENQTDVTYFIRWAITN
ncbi:elongation factor Ts ['Fragaria x ananassa' phyllody phytoplasma]|uniref:Elongation factor Ts n=1 Tax='Fragaria x ananassa' phyllody phytoplasma TaxID=2358428 RepID=A0ABS5K3K1_9MOLU|nr:translation elongation factor Ts ['Fragaria x ananassa' phyllody phytoplasma]MBS2126481.1 elongation factor Ts ['Fragaria x ananassa' phyllody phytoplasma]